MKWFNQEFLTFFEELTANNNREWFNSNKQRFKEEVEAPFHRFVTELIRRFEMEGAPLGITSKLAVYRIYRDIRFSKDKTPYKTQMSAILAPGGRKSPLTMGLYLEANHTKLYLYEGFFRPPKALLERIRYAIAADIEAFNRVIYDTRLTAAFSPLLGEKNKRLPNDLREAAQKQPLLYHKSFFIRAELSPTLLLSNNLIDIVWQYHTLAGPFNQFIMEAIEQ